MLFLHINNNDRATKKRWGDKGPYHCWPLSPSDRSTLYLNKMCSMTLALFLWVKHTPPPTSPWQFAKIVHSHQPSLRLQAAARRKTIGSRAQNTSLLDADCSSIGRKGEKKSWIKKAVSPHRWSEPVFFYHPTSTPTEFHWLSKAGPQISIKKRHSTKVP